MKKRFTRFIGRKSLMKVKTFSLLALGMFLSSAVYGQYCTVSHYYGCGSNGTDYYGAIEEVSFHANGKELWKKAADGCVDKSSSPSRTSGHHHIITTTPTFSLSYGSDFSIQVNASGRFYRITQLAIWMDVNRDGDFTDKEDWMGQHQVTSSTGGPLPTKTEINLSLPCGATGSGTSVIRLRSTYQYTNYVAGNSCASGTNPFAVYYGETEDFAVTLDNPSTLAAGFFVVDTAFVKTVVDFKNTNQAGYFYHGWDMADDGSVEYTSVDASHKFSTVGKNCVELRSDNCLGSDSIVKCFEIVKPTAPPVADFISDRNVVELYNTFTLTDLSTNGAIYWDWFLYQGHGQDSTDSRIDGDDMAALRGGDETFNKNPEVFTLKGIPGFPDQGVWSVGLIASNDLGPSVQIIKEDYIEVTKGCDVEMGPGTVTGIPGNVITCVAGSLTNKDNGSGNYSSPEANLDALIAPCGAEEITFTFEQWAVKSNVNLKVYDGQDANGIALHPKNGFTATDTATGPLVAKSGAMYFLWNSTGTQTDKGFLGRWTSKIGSQSPPVADFDAPSIMYNAVENKFTNTSANATGEVFYTWEIDGTVESTSKDFFKTFTSNQNYSVCLTVETCAGKNKTCETITVSPITSKTELDFVADERRPKAGDKVSFEATADKANTFLWNFFPGTTVKYVDGTSASSKTPVVTFSSPGKYTVSLKAWNSLSPQDSAASAAQVIKADYIIVIDYCTPVIGVTNSNDIAVNQFTISNTDSPAAVLLDNESGTAAYTDYTEELPAPRLTFGGSYDITLKRNTTVNKMSRKVWIDYNIDGDFNDPGEMVINESPAQTASYTGRITIPDLKNSFEGKTRMRVATSYDSDPNVPCGATSGVKNANRIGEFEDYAILLSNDFTIPVITMNGMDTAYVELGKTYTDAGATAEDPTEGDITSRMVTVSDVDVTAAGIYYITYDVEDASGNKAGTQTRVVIVTVDQSAPVIALTDGNVGAGDPTVRVDVITGTFTEPGFSATDVTDGNLTTAVQVSGTVNTFKIGTYVLTYTVQDVQGNIAIAKRNVIVEDKVFPTINNDELQSGVVNVQLESVFVDRTLPSDNYNNGVFGPMFTYTISPANAQGEADVDTRVKGTTTVTYTATDESGNQTILVIDYVVEDYIAPVIDLRTLDTVYHPVNKKYTAEEAKVEDNFYDETQVSLTRVSNVNPYRLGLYTDTYTATDASGNKTVKPRYVRVFDGVRPTISGKTGPIVRLGLFSNVSLVNYLAMQDNYDAPQVLFDNVKVTYNDLNVYEEGVYAAVFETVDNSGNVSAPFTLMIEVSSKYESYSVNDVAGMDLLNVYPNPSTGIFNVSVDLPTSEEVTIGVYDMLGNQVADVAKTTMSNGTYTIDMSSNASGVYFVRMNVSGTVYTQRVILN